MRFGCSYIFAALFISSFVSCAPQMMSEQGDGADVVVQPPGFTRHTLEGIERWGAFASGNEEVAYVFGGTNLSDFGGSVFNGFHRFDASTGSLTPLELSNAPSPRYCGCTAYDSESEKFLIVGGRDRSTLFDTLFIIDTNTLETRELALSIDRALGCAATVAEGKAYIFGGASQQGYSDQTFVFDFADESLIEVQSVVRPPPRYDASMLRVGDALFMAGGSTSPVNIAAFTTDLWRFDLTNQEWSLVDANAITGRRTPFMAHDKQAGFYIGFGAFGTGFGEVHGDLYHFDVESSTLEEVVFDEMPAARGFSIALPAADGIAYLLSGTDFESVFSDAWVLH